MNVATFLQLCHAAFVTRFFVTVCCAASDQLARQHLAAAWKSVPPHSRHVCSYACRFSLRTVIASSIVHICQNTAESCVIAWSRNTKIPQAHQKKKNTGKQKKYTSSDHMKGTNEVLLLSGWVR